MDLSGLDACFTEEIWATVKDLPSDRAPGPDGFTGLFYKVAWETIKVDIIHAFNALWSLDARSFYLLNDALMVLIRKTNSPAGLKDYRPISLMHSFSSCLPNAWHGDCRRSWNSWLQLTRVHSSKTDLYMTISEVCSWHVGG